MENAQNNQVQVEESKTADAKGEVVMEETQEVNGTSSRILKIGGEAVLTDTITDNNDERVFQSAEETNTSDKVYSVRGETTPIAHVDEAAFYPTTENSVNIPENEKWLHEPETKKSIDEAVNWALNHPVTQVDNVETDTTSSPSVTDTKHPLEVEPVKVRRQENNKPKKQKSMTTNQQQQKKKPVDLSRLLNLGQTIADNHMKAGNVTKSPGNFKRFVPDIKNEVVESVKTEDEGKTHINISYASTLTVGKLLDLYALSPFTTPQAGTFNSIGGLQDYLKSGQDNTFRTTSGRNGRELGSKHKGHPVQGLRQMLAEATWFKVIQNDKLMNALLASTLPFRSYYLQQGKVVLTSLESWYIPVVDEIRRVIKVNNENILLARSEGKEIKPEDVVYPDFSFLEKKQSPKK